MKWRSGSHKREGVLEVTPEHEVRLSSGEYVRADQLEARRQGNGAWQGHDGMGLLQRIYATGYPGPMREHRSCSRPPTATLPEHVHHIDENKLNNLPENLVGLTNSEHVRHHVNGRMNATERSRLADIVKKSWVRDRDKRLRSLKRGDESQQLARPRQRVDGTSAVGECGQAHSVQRCTRNRLRHGLQVSQDCTALTGKR